MQLNMEQIQIESLVITAEGRRQLGEMSASEGLDSIVAQHLAFLDLSEEWRWEIESARLEKLRDMASKDDDAGRLYTESDKRMKRTIGALVEIENNASVEQSVAPQANPSLSIPTYPSVGLGI